MWADLGDDHGIKTYIPIVCFLEINIRCRQRPYCDECTRSHPNSEVKHHKARSVLGWGTAWEALRVPLAFYEILCFLIPRRVCTVAGLHRHGRIAQTSYPQRRHARKQRLHRFGLNIVSDVSRAKIEEVTLNALRTRQSLVKGERLVRTEVRAVLDFINVISSGRCGSKQLVGIPYSLFFKISPHLHSMQGHPIDGAVLS